MITDTEVKQTAITILSVLLLVGWAHAMAIMCSYDEQHRLAETNFNNQATVRYDYDKVDNLIGYTVLTDSQYFKPLLLYFTLLHDDLVRPKYYRESLPPTDSSAIRQRPAG